ncbi:uncharacterized protein LOC111708382 [Eurytemora carolleeae]|uniref:uncharacterized protein LOC111708382 n=1 Tax=Eurytemora carolleeae TaxID=1294199 RepID=UPI000C785877|nr:uncharacterized protein LOC111708382 [Eurytemora carolleeae]|eukprot:XP_023337506.1 uncharacterized protein LOC111708382 [Eurytemora affinis]
MRMLRYILPLLLLSASYGSSLRSNVDLFLKDSKPSLSQLKEKLSESVPILGRFNDTRVSCDACLIIKSSSSSVSGIFPWLFNNAKFYFSNFDGYGYPVYQTNVGSNNYYLHFYDEGIFYDGFWVVNDSAGNYIEETGKVFIYNTHSYTCPKDTGSGWYYFQNGEWIYHESITPAIC